MVAALLLHLLGPVQKGDWRNINSGLIIPDESYADQPYVVINAEGHWVATLTTNPSHEGAPGQHVVSRISTDSTPWPTTWNWRKDWE